MENTERFEEKARELASKHYTGSDYWSDNSYVPFTPDDIKVVWFCKTLKNWKAMVAILTPRGPFYEITYNGDKQEAYVDCYRKVDNVCVPD